jgi:hypothetical protein
VAELDPTFMELVQNHERLWGMEQYVNRPSLAELLNKPIVVMWSSDERRATTTTAPARADAKRLTVGASPSERYMFTTHNSVDELNDIVLSMVVMGKPNKFAGRKMARLFVHQKPVQITGVKLTVSDKK